ncbi:lasso peptide biosynthesis B2 protein [Yinghuangia aomiensis]
MNRLYTAPTPIHAVAYGHVTVLVDTRHDRVHALTGPAAAWWHALARHGNPRDAAHAAGLADGDADVLANELADAGFLTPTHTPLPWNPPIHGRQPSPSRGTTTAPVALPTQLRPPARWLLRALPAVALTCLANHASPAATVVTRHRTLATIAARTAHRRSWRQADPDEIRQAAHAVRAVARYLPTRFACFEEAIATHLALTAAARGACWCHGTAPDPVRLHAWIEQTGTRHAPAEPPETSAYTAFTRISPTTLARRSLSPPTPR